MAKRTRTILAFLVSFILAAIFALTLTVAVAAMLIGMAGINTWLSYIVGAFFGLLSIALGLTTFEILISLPTMFRFRKQLDSPAESATYEET